MSRNHGAVTTVPALVGGEALALDRRDLPADEAKDDAALVVAGKGGKQRVVPLLAVVRAAIADYLAACRRIASSIRLLKSDGLEADTPEEAHDSPPNA